MKFSKGERKRLVTFVWKVQLGIWMNLTFFLAGMVMGAVFTGSMIIEAIK